MINLALAIPSEIYLETLTEIIESDETIKVVSKLKNQTQIIECLKITSFDVLFLDLSIPRLDIAEIFNQLKSLSKTPGIIAYFHEDNEELLIKAISYGFNSSLGLNATIEDLCSAIKAVSTGEIWADHKILSSALKKFINRDKTTFNKIEARLTKREIDISKLILDGLSNKAIAKNLFISERTVKVHISNIFKKLGIKHRYQLSTGMLKDKDLF